MILPTVLYHVNDAMRDMLLQSCTRISKAARLPFQVRLCTDDVDEVMMQLHNENSVTLLILGVSPLQDDKEQLSLRLGKWAMRVNRDHYVVYLIEERGELERVLPFCSRSAGILVCPLQEKDMELTFKPVFQDYRHMYEQAASEDGRWLNLKSEGRVYRIRLREVCTIQALNKEIEFCTMERSIRIYSSMAAVEKMLDSSFIRCHRSYFINSQRIQFVDFREMCIHMMDGSVIPLARSFKDRFCQGIAQRA